MNKKGFTLIELLAVIVVLALILIIAIPRILNVIEDSEKETFRISGENLVRAAKENALKGLNSDEKKTYTITDGEFIGDKLPISGKLPNNGTVIIDEDGQISLSISNNKWCARKSFEEDKLVIDSDIVTCRIIEPTDASCFTYTKTSTEVTITDYNETCTKDVIIPNKIEGLPVTSIGFAAFYRNQLTSVDIPSSVTSIASHAFSSNQLTSVVIPSSVTSIGLDAFYWNQLTSVVIPSSVTSIGANAFFRNRLTSVVIPSSVTSIASNAFSGNQLTSVVIPSSVTSIGSFAFSYNQLTSVVIPSSVTSIVSYAFYDNQLTNIVIPSSVTNIGVAAFNINQLPDNQAFIYKRNSDGSEDKTTIVSYGGAKRDNVSIPNSVTSIGSYAFSNNQLTSVDIPSSVTSIGEWAFYDNQLTSVDIPSSVTSIGSSTFRSNQLTSVVIPSSVTLSDSSISPSFYTAYVTNNGSTGGTYTAPSQSGTWTKQ